MNAKDKEIDTLMKGDNTHRQVFAKTRENLMTTKE